MTEEQLVKELEIIQRKQLDFTLEFKKAENMMQKAYEGSLDTFNQMQKLMKKLVKELEIIQRKQLDFTLEFKKAENMMQKAYEGSLDTFNQMQKLMKKIDIFHTTLKFNQKR